jgi:hypothetical protein
VIFLGKFLRHDLVFMIFKVIGLFKYLICA